MKNNLELLKEVMPLFKIGVTNSDYPPHAQYIFFDEETIKTFNSDIHVEIAIPTEIKGAINYFVLNGILLKIGTFTYDVTATTLNIEDELGYNYEIPIERIEPPNIVKNEFTYITLSYKSALIIKEAAAITTQVAKKSAISNRIYSYVIIKDNYVISTDNSRAFLGQLDVNSNEILVLDKILVSLLDENVEIGTTGYFSSLQIGDNIKILSAIDDMTLFPYNNLLNLFEKSRGDYKPVCNLNSLHEVIKIIQPVLYKEKSRVIDLCNKDKELTISGGSIVNGVITKTIQSHMTEEIEMSISIDSLKGINKDKLFCINPKTIDRFYLSGDGSELIIRTCSG